jgi:hypothetical protein
VVTEIFAIVSGKDSDGDRQMLKHIDDIRKSARIRAARRWKNWEVTKNFKAAQKEATEGAAEEPKEILPSDTIINEGLKSGSLVRAQTKFAKDIKEMMEGHSEKALALYRHSLEHKRYRLLKEKLRRLKLAEAQQATEKKNERPSLF